MPYKSCTSSARLRLTIVLSHSRFDAGVKASDVTPHECLQDNEKVADVACADSHGLKGNPEKWFDNFTEKKKKKT